MKNLQFIIFVFILASCKSFDLSMIKAENDPLNPKLPALEKRIEDIGNASIVMDSRELSLITDHLEKNIIDPYGKKKGSIAVMRKAGKSKIGIGWYLPSLLTYGTLNIFGFPFAHPSQEIEVEVRILDNENSLIGKYSAVGKAKTMVAAYYGYGLGSANRKNYTDAYNEAFRDIREQIKPDLPRLIKALE